MTTKSMWGKMSFYGYFYSILSNCLSIEIQKIITYFSSNSESYKKSVTMKSKNGKKWQILFTLFCLTFLLLGTGKL